MTRAVEDIVVRSRRTLQNIIDGRDPRLFVVVGPARSTTSAPPWSTPGA